MCKCGFFNTLRLPDNPLNCNVCKAGSKWSPLCTYHQAISEGKRARHKNTHCGACWKNFRYSDPNYDALGVMMQLAKKALSLLRSDQFTDNDFANPKWMRNDFQEIEDKLAAGTISKDVALDHVDNILWNTCGHMDFRYAGNSLGDMLDWIDDISKDLIWYERFVNEREQDQHDFAEEMKAHPGTFQVKSSDRKTTYYVNIDKQYCSCPGFKNCRKCKHLNP